MIVRVLVVVLLALVAAVAAGHFIAADPGFVVIGYGGKVIRSTFAFFAIVVVLAVLLLYIVLRLLGNLFALRKRWRRWSEDYRRRRAHRSLANGRLALAVGDFARAERLFSQGVDEDAQPEVHYLAAAEAAQAQHANARRDNYLRLAHEVEPAAAAALDLQHANWLLEHDQLEQAAALIDRLAKTEVSTPALLRLRLQLARRRQDWAVLLQLLPALRRDRVLSHDQANVLERDCALTLLRTTVTEPARLRAIWDGLSKPLKAAPAVVATYVRGLVQSGQADEAEQLLARQLDRSWDSDLAAFYGEIACASPTRQLRKVEAWAATRDNDAGLRLARARLAMRAKLWGPARTQLEQLRQQAPSPLYYQLLADIADATADEETARRYRKLGLELATADGLPTHRSLSHSG